MQNQLDLQEEVDYWFTRQSLDDHGEHMDHSGKLLGTPTFGHTARRSNWLRSSANRLIRPEVGLHGCEGHNNQFETSEALSKAVLGRERIYDKISVHDDEINVCLGDETHVLRLNNSCSFDSIRVNRIASLLCEELRILISSTVSRLIWVANVPLGVGLGSVRAQGR